MSVKSDEENDLAHILEAKRHHEDDANELKEALLQIREESEAQEAEIQVLKEKQVCTSVSTIK